MALVTALLTLLRAALLGLPDSVAVLILATILALLVLAACASAGGVQPSVLAVGPPRTAPVVEVPNPFFCPRRATP